MTTQQGSAFKKTSGVTRFAIATIIVWTIAIIASLFMCYFSHKKGYIDHAVGNARGAFNKDLVYRRWVSSVGGVYVLEKNGVKPNPYLAAVDRRDLVTTDGSRLTMVNPAYMTRMVHEMGNKQYGARGHITSLKPLRPENRADEWETKALKKFEYGKVNEYYEVEDDKHGGKLLKYMKAVYVEKACLACHAVQGYQVGEVRGGISVYVPMEHYVPMFFKDKLWLIIAHIIVWALGCAGEIIGAVAINRSNNQRDRAEQELREHRDNLELLVQERTEALKQKKSDFSNFIYSVAHDMKSPLVTIDGFVDIVTEDCGDNLGPDATRYFDRIKVAVANLRSRIEKLLNYSKLEAVPNAYEPCNFRQIASAALHNIEGSIVKRNIAARALESADVEIVADRERITQLMENLLSNSVKYIGVDNPEPRIEVGSEKRGGKTVFFVRDNGIGIAEEHRESAFELCKRLYKGDDIEGSGIGLATAKRIAANHGGTIWIESEGPGAGCAVCFTLGETKDLMNTN